MFTTLTFFPLVSPLRRLIWGSQRLVRLTESLQSPLTSPVFMILREKNLPPALPPAQSLTTAAPPLSPPVIISVRSVQTGVEDISTCSPKLYEEEDHVLFHWKDSVCKICFASMMFISGWRSSHTFRPVINTASSAPTFLPKISVDSQSNVGVEEVAGNLIVGGGKSWETDGTRTGGWTWLK